MLFATDEREIVYFNSSPELVATPEKQTWDLVLTDLRTPELSGVDVLEAVKAHAPDTSAILINAYATIETAGGAMKAVAFGYVQKPFDNQATQALVEKSRAFEQFSRENRRLSAAVRNQ